ncbi:hypothetical protein PhCBS80983_g03937 [Powellomyces hirtus]|uniref:Uncharacterized protein n=1 Tax=Powellomyces hirtus TaxID=109895 RepID=A0A507E1M3_9FUNG|nr:hypothetical protein PhCBS80983_g03937 [Powellomyces hirtus]
MSQYNLNSNNRDSFYSSTSSLFSSASYSEGGKSIYDKPSQALMDELRNGPVQASTVGTASEVRQNFRDQMLAKGGSSGSLFGDGKDAVSHQKASW